MGGGVGAVLGDWLQIQGSASLNLATFQFAAEIGVTYTGNSAGIFYIVGSNSGTGTWDPIIYCTLLSSGYNSLASAYYTQLGSSTYCTSLYSIPSGTITGTNGNLTYTTYGNGSNTYQYFRIIATNLCGGSNSNGYWVINANLGFNTITIGSYAQIPVSISCVDISADGTKMIAAANVVGQGLFLSTSSGSNWTQLYTNNGLPTDLISMDNGSNKVAISNDGTKISVAYTNGYVYYSSNSGASFQIVSPPGRTGNSQGGQNVPKNYWGLGMSKDGAKLVTAVNNGSLIPDLTKISSLLITNPGTGLPATATYGKTAISYSGQYQAVTQTSATAGLWTSSNYGNYWLFQSVYGAGGRIGISGTGQYIATNDSTGKILYISSNFGVTWISNPRGYSAGSYDIFGIALSSTGQYILISIFYGNAVYSSNYGNNFIFVADMRSQGAGISYSGQYMYIGNYGAGYSNYISSSYGAYWSSNQYYYNAANNGNTGAVAVSGSGQYILVAASGTGFNVSSTYGVNFYYTTMSPTWSQLYISQTGQIMIGATNASTIYYSINYGVNWLSYSVNVNGGISASSTCQYLLGAGPNVKLTTFPYYSNGKNLIGLSWSAISGNGLPATATSQYIQYSYTGQYVLVATTTFAVLLSSNYGNNWLGTNSGISWPTGSSNNVTQVGVSNSGQYMTAVNGKALLSTNYGYNWTQSPGGLSGVLSWQETSVSGNGNYILFATGASSPVIWLSSTSGSTFYQLTNFSGSTFQNVSPYEQICISNTGQYILVPTSNWPYLSTSYGQYWTQQPGTGMTGYTQMWGPAAMSQDGKYMLIMQQNTGFFLSSNAGAFWQLTSVGADSNGYRTASMSASGQYIILSNNAVNWIRWSTDYGSNWIVNPGGLTNIAYTTSFISPNAQYATVGIAGTLYVSTYKDQPWLSQNQIGQQWTPVGNLPNTFGGSAISQNGQYIIFCGSAGTYPWLSSNYGNYFNNLTSAYSLADFTITTISYSGQYILYGTGAKLCLSSNYGINWLLINSTSGFNYGLAMSGNGQFMAVTSYPTGLYLSSSFGKYWQINSVSSLPNAIQAPYGYGGTLAISYTGQYIYTYSYMSSTFGNNWYYYYVSPGVLVSAYYNSIATSYTGQYVVVSQFSSLSGIYSSSNYGASFFLYDSGSGLFGFGIGMSASGKYIITGSDFSSDYGSSYVTIPLLSSYRGTNFYSASISADGNYILSCPGPAVYLSSPLNVDGGISYSSDSGNNWIAGGNLTGPNFDSVAISADGSSVLAGTHGSFPYISTSTSNTFSPILSIASNNTYGTSLSSSGQYGILSQQNQQGTTGLYVTSSYGVNWTSGSVSVNVSGVVSTATIADAFYGGASISQDGQLLVAAAGANVYIPSGPLATFTPITMPTTTTIDGTTLRYITKY